MIRFNDQYWEDRYKENKTGWDIGYVSTPLKTYFDQLNDKDIKILIPGAGNAHEAIYLWENGFKNIYILDWAKQPLENLKAKIPGIPNNQLLNTDFFKLNNAFDLIVEQTFFCALDPSLRSPYMQKMEELLVPKGKLAGLLFDFPLTEEGPPFGGNKKMYIDYLASQLDIITLEKCNNSIEPRSNKEFFFIAQKKPTAQP